MTEVTALLLPIFAVIAIGRGAVQCRLVDERGVRGINEFTLRLAFPALLFGSITSGAGVGVFGIAGVYLAGCLGVYGVALAIARITLRAPLARGAAFALTATYGSAAYIALPLVSAMFGAAGLAQIVPIIALHSGVLLPLATVLIEIGNHADDGGGVFRSTVRRLARNPIVMSIAVGFLWRATGLPVPTPLSALLRLLGSAAPALALFCVGASLPNVSGGSSREAALAVCLKLGLLPLTIWVLSVAAGLSGQALKVALLTAVMPTGANAFLVAQRAAAFSQTSARAVAISLVLSLPVVSGLMIGLR